MLKVPFSTKLSTLNQTLTALLDKCQSMSELKQIHALLLAFGLSQEDSFASKIFSFSALSDWGNVDYSFRFLSQLSCPATFYWNTVIRGYSKSRNPNRSILVFIRMLRNGVSPDYLTYPFLAKAAACLMKRQLGVAIHACISKHGYESDRFVQNSMIHMYASCGDIAYARKIFDSMSQRNSVSWNSMVDGYAKCGDVNSAQEVFELMPVKDVVSWSCLIGGYVKAGEYMEALAIFQQMQTAGAKANDVTMVSVLCACAHLGALEQGSRMHRYILENGLPLTLVLKTSLVDMYAKCGEIEEALGLFRSSSMRKTDVLLWNAMIGGLATHGLVKESLDLFDEMQRIRILPDEITYLCLLSACAHGGLVKKAWYFFECLAKHGMTPKSEHYACMVDVLARAGQVEDAFQFICQMPIEPTASMLGALLSGCMNHGKLELGELVGRKLIEIEPDHDGRYVGLSNVYAVFKRWDEARNMREAMERRRVKKFPGFSFVEVSGMLNRFIAHDKRHPKSEEIYAILIFVTKQIKLDADYENLEYHHLLQDIQDSCFWTTL